MTAVALRVPAALRGFAAGRAVLDLELGAGADVGGLLDAVAATHPALERRIRDEQGRLRRHVNVFVDGINVRDLEAQATPLADGSEVVILPAVSGG